MKKTGFVFMILGLLLLVLNCNRNVDVNKIMSQVANSVVKVEVTTLSNERQTGSGFIIDRRGFVVTNDHVLGAVADITIKLHDNRNFSGEEVGVLYRNELQDIAILKLNDSGLPALAIGDSPAFLEDVYVVGYPFSRPTTTTATGKMNSIEETILDEFSYISISATLDPGYSGAPVVSKTGQVLGIATRIEGRNQNYAVPIRYVRSIIEKVDNVLLENSSCSGQLIFHDDFLNPFSNDWVEISGNWIRGYGRYVQISQISYPYQENVFGLTVTRKNFQDFCLTTRMMSVTRFDGYRNIDMGIVFRFTDPSNFYLFSTFSREPWNQDQGGLWRVVNGVWGQPLQSSSLVQTFQNMRWYCVKIIAEGNHIRVYLDNLKSIDVRDNFFISGPIGYRTVSSHTWFSDLKVFSIN